MKHWTQASAKDFAYSISLDFFTQLEDRLERLEMNRKRFSERLELSPGRISQIFNNPPPNPKVESLVQYARALGMKVALVAYDDDDPGNDRGPIFSEVFTRAWQEAGSPRDLSASEGEFRIASADTIIVDADFAEMEPRQVTAFNEGTLKRDVA